MERDGGERTNYAKLIQNCIHILVVSTENFLWADIQKEETRFWILKGSFMGCNGKVIKQVVLQITVGRE